MASPLQQRLVVVTGKGGVGKTTIASALGLLAAGRGKRTIVVEVGEQQRVAELLGLGASAPGTERELTPGLFSISIDPDRALLEWLQQLGGRVSGRVLASSSTFKYFAAAAPGAKELVTMVKIWELTQRRRWRGRAPGYDLVILDAPATGHALGLLSSPRTFAAIARVGSVANQAAHVQELLRDPERSSFLAVAQASEMAVSETLELQTQLERQLDRELYAVLVNGVLPRRFNDRELRLLGELEDGAGDRDSPAGNRPGASTARRAGAAPQRPATDAEVTGSVARAARAAHERTRFQQNQIARLRRRRLRVLSVPFHFGRELDLAAVQSIAKRLGRTL